MFPGHIVQQAKEYSFILSKSSLYSQLSNAIALFFFLSAAAMLALVVFSAGELKRGA